MVCIFSDEVIQAFISLVTEAISDIEALLDYQAPSDWRKWKTEAEALNSTCSHSIKRLWNIRRNLLDSSAASQVIESVRSRNDFDSTKLNHIIGYQAPNLSSHKS